MSASGSMLDKFRASKRPEVEGLYQDRDAGLLPEPHPGERPPFGARLRERGPAALIAEYKRASPSLGEINMELTPEQAAQTFAEAGAAAMSVLTETEHFAGELHYLERCAGAGLPLLRKDFLFDPLQVALTAATPASAFLLVVRMFENASQLAAMIEAGREAGLEAVVEIFDERDLGLARDAGSAIIQVNSRDLDTLELDAANQHRLIANRWPDEVWIAASGVRTAEDAATMADLGYEAVLVGTAIMRADDPAAKARELAGGS